jgi:hypothetical protein
LPSTTPLNETHPLMQTGQAGDLYMYTATGDFRIPRGKPWYRTTLWLCTASRADTGGQALWAQVLLGDTIGGL